MHWRGAPYARDQINRPWKRRWGLIEHRLLPILVTPEENATVKRRRSTEGPEFEVPRVAQELPLGDEDVAPDPLFPRWVRRTLAVAAIVVALTLTTRIALYWTVGDDWGWRCGPDHPWYDANMSEHYGASCPEPISL